MMPSWLWMLAGPNGCGKTSRAQAFPIQSLIPDVEFLNPDDATKQKLISQGYQGFHDSPSELQRSLFIEAADEVSTRLHEAVSNGRKVGIETVLSTGKYLSLVEQVRSGSGYFMLIYIVVNSPELACERVAARAAKKGHSVPPDKIHDRWYKSIQNLPKFAALAKAFWVFDNSDSNPENAPVLVARGVDGQLVRPPLASFPLLDQQLARIPIQGQA